MYAHQVIDSILVSNVLMNSSEKLWYIEKIQNSQKFYFESHGAIQGLFVKDVGKKCVFCDNVDEIKFPYNTMFVGFGHSKESSRFFASLVCYDPRTGRAEIFFFEKNPNFETSHWIMLPFGVWAYVGENSPRRGESIDIVYPYKGCKQIFTNNEDQGKFIKDAGYVSLPAAIEQFLLLLNCRNITTIDNEPPAKLNKSRVKKGKQPLFTYKTLVIKPTGKRQEALAAQGLWENRIHLCRGHFKTYTEDKPLFGRYTGRYWWQPSVRGRNRDGIVMKDYKLETPTPEAPCLPLTA